MKKIKHLFALRDKENSCQSKKFVGFGISEQMLFSSTFPHRNGKCHIFSRSPFKTVSRKRIFSFLPKAHWARQRIVLVLCGLKFNNRHSGPRHTKFWAPLTYWNVFVIYHVFPQCLWYIFWVFWSSVRGMDPNCTHPIFASNYTHFWNLNSPETIQPNSAWSSLSMCMILSMKENQNSSSRMVFQKKREKVASNARQSFNQSSNNMGVRIVWCKKGVRIVWVHPSYRKIFVLIFSLINSFLPLLEICDWPENVLCLPSSSLTIPKSPTRRWRRSVADVTDSATQTLAASECSGPSGYFANVTDGCLRWTQKKRFLSF